MSDRPDHDAEEMDFIPWSRLVDDNGPGAPRLVYVAAAAVLALGVGAIAAPRLLRSDVPASTLDIPAETVSAAVQPDATESRPVPSEVPASAPVASNLVGDEARRAKVAAVAEIFVQDYFTRDLDPNRALDLATWEIEPGPQETSTYVEWARTVEIEAHDADWSVDVAFRVITSVDGTFVRQPIRFVTQRVDAGEQPVGLPVVAHRQLAASQVPTSFLEVPAEIGAEAVQALDPSWQHAEPREGYETENGWDVVMELSDGARVVVSVPNS